MEVDALFGLVERGDSGSVARALALGGQGPVLGRSRDAQGRTALMSAASRGDTRLLHVLAPYSDIQARDYRQGKTAAQWAFDCGHPECASWLAHDGPLV